MSETKCIFCGLEIEPGEPATVVDTAVFGRPLEGRDRVLIHIHCLSTSFRNMASIMAGLLDSAYPRPPRPPHGQQKLGL